ncbi:Uncharacterised protein [Mycobacteroides abscessus subsp. massiliense]|nr:Uncharacterised protein [Mycobacteroides abscessus subsp. massiliense]SKV06697.1 Uncharacterised protein [Mycobacteroides abscessus subsp. massiliense]SLD45193.1 Uncharacterised protein [Mycobacteroides abscessus subsp. bolletii]
MPVVRVIALCLALAGLTAAVTFTVATRIAPGEHPQDPRIHQGRFGW